MDQLDQNGNVFLALSRIAIVFKFLHSKHNPRMVRFLLTVAVLCALGAAVLGFANRAKLLRLDQELSDAEIARDDARGKLNDVQQQLQQKLNDVQQRLKQTEDRLSTQERLTQQERDSRNGELNATKAKLNRLTEQLTARDSENKALTAAITEAGRNLEQKQRAEEDRQALAKRLIETEDELNQYRIAEGKGESKYPVDLEGSVVSINRDAKALTVSLGTDAGIAPNSRLTVVRNGEKLAELRVVSVETTTCVAEFASPSPDNFSKVVVGDSVISTIK
jgi:HAMP domain-containing protein